MSAFTDLAVRVRALLARGAEEADLAEELRDHLDCETDARIRQGMPPDEAARSARLAFGGVERCREQVRDARGTRAFEDLLADGRYALRSLRRQPAFALTVILVLSLGLGATTVVASIMDAVVLADLPYPEPDRLVHVMEQNAPDNRWGLSNADVSAIRDEQRSFAAFGAAQRGVVALTGPGAPERIVAGRATAGFFDAVRITPAVGRLIRPGDEAVDAPPVLVLSDRIARERFGTASTAVGKTLAIDGVAHTIVGVLPPGADDLAGFPADAWSALSLPPPTRRGPFGLGGVGRLRPGVTLDAAARDLAGVSARLLPRWPDFRDSTARLTPRPLRELVVGSSGRSVGLLAGGVGLVLLLAVFNVATLVLVRTSARGPELAVRVMLGARRGRVVRLLLTENLLLTLVAGLVGIGLAVASLDVVVRQLPTLPRIARATIDWQVMAAGLATALAAGVAVSLSPILALGGAPLPRQAAAQRTGPGAAANRMRRAFVVGQFTLAWPLLAVAGLLLVSFARLQRVDPGFDPDGLMSVAMTLPPTRYPDLPDLEAFWRQAEQRAGAVPGVSHVGLATQVPPDRSGNVDNFNLVSRPVPAGEAEPVTPWYYATPGYFEALGIRVSIGRTFLPADNQAADPVVVVSRSWAMHYFGRPDVVGERLIQGGCAQCPPTTIVGVVEDIRNLGPSEPSDAVYGPLDQGAPRSLHLVVRHAGTTARVAQALRDALASLDPDLPVSVSSLAERQAAGLADPRRLAGILGAFSVTGLLLACLGVFGLMAYTVRQQRRDIGVRVALGATPSRMTRLVVWRGMRLALTGSVAGIALALVVTSRLRTLLFDVTPWDPATLLAVGVLLLGSAAAACWGPGRRAARIGPAEVIATE